MLDKNDELGHKHEVKIGEVLRVYTSYAVGKKNPTHENLTKFHGFIVSLIA